MRLFVAIDIDEQVRERIARIQSHLKRELNLSGCEVKWVRPEQIHLTLKFLGDVPDKIITRVCDAVTRTAGRFDGFEFEVAGVGVFGNPARVVWAGCKPCPVMVQLQSELDEAFSQLGWDKEIRPFTGHLTLCRVKNAAAGRKLAPAVEAFKDEIFGTVSVQEIRLIESRLSSAGPEYTVVCTGALK